MQQPLPRGEETGSSGRRILQFGLLILVAGAVALALTRAEALLLDMARFAGCL